MLYIKYCCGREHFYKYFDYVKPAINDIIKIALRKELFGDATVICNYNRLNDIKILKDRLDIYVKEVFNVFYGKHLGLPTKSFEELLAELCIDDIIKKYDYIPILKILDLYTIKGHELEPNHSEHIVI